MSGYDAFKSSAGKSSGVMGPGSIMEFDSMDSMKIKVLLKVLDKHNLIFQVLWMDERFCGMTGAPIEFSSIILVRSSSHPSIPYVDKKITSIFLRGDFKKYDNRACIAYVKDAYVEKERIIAALKDWAANWSGFKDDYSNEKDSVDDIYCI